MKRIAIVLAATCIGIMIGIEIIAVGYMVIRCPWLTLGPEDDGQFHWPDRIRICLQE